LQENAKKKKPKTMHSKMIKLRRTKEIESITDNRIASGQHEEFPDLIIEVLLTSLHFLTEVTLFNGRQKSGVGTN
jgi:hypothetical protein